MVSALTLLWVIPSSKLTCAAISKVHKVLSLANSLGEWCKSSSRASVCSLEKAVWVCLGREEPRNQGIHPPPVEVVDSVAHRLRSAPKMLAIWGVYTGAGQEYLATTQDEGVLGAQAFLQALRSFSKIYVRTKMGFS